MLLSQYTDRSSPVCHYSYSLWTCPTCGFISTWMDTATDNNNSSSSSINSTTPSNMKKEDTSSVTVSTLATEKMLSTPYYTNTPTAPPYLERQHHHPTHHSHLPHLPHPQPQPQPGMHGGKPPLPSVHFQNTFESVDLESGPNSPPAHVNRPMIMMPGAQPPRGGGDQEDSTSLPSKNLKRRRYRQNFLYLAVIALIVILASVITGVLVMHYGPVRQPVPAEKLHTNCVSCSVLETAMADSAGRVPVNVAELDIRNSPDGKLLCCLKVSDKTDAILEMLLQHARQNAPAGPPQQRVENRTELPTTVREASAQVAQRNQAAALVGLERSLPVNIKDDDIYTLKEWGTQSSSVMYIRPLIKFTSTNGHFTVPFDGLYTINIHLSLSNTDSAKPMVQFGQSLVRFNRHFPQMGEEHLAFDQENVPAHEQRTSSLALTVHLRKDDELFSQVSPTSVVVEDASRSFFCIVFQSA